MAVVLQYLVVRNGSEKMSFTNKKEADAYDKLLDLAEHLDSVLAEAPVSLNETDRESLALYLAEHQALLSLPKKTAPKKAVSKKAAKPAAVTPDANVSDTSASDTNVADANSSDTHFSDTHSSDIKPFAAASGE